MTQNKKKGIAKKALSISLVAAMLATSNVPVWASGFEAVDPEAQVLEEAVYEATPVFEEDSLLAADDTVLGEADVNIDLSIKEDSVKWGETATVVGSGITKKDGAALSEGWNYGWRLKDAATAKQTGAGTDADKNYTTEKIDANQVLELYVWCNTEEAKFGPVVVDSVSVGKRTLKSVTVGSGNLPYNGFDQSINAERVTVTDEKDEPVAKEDYSISSTTAKNANETITVSITANNDAYEGNINKTFTINAIPFDVDYFVASVNEGLEYQYTGKNIEIPVSNVTLKETLSEAEDDGKLGGNDLTVAVTKAETADKTVGKQQVVLSVDRNAFTNFARMGNNQTFTTPATDFVNIVKRDLASTSTNIVVATGDVKLGSTLSTLPLVFTDAISGTELTLVYNTDYVLSAKNSKGKTVTKFDEVGDYTVTVEAKGGNTVNSQTLAVSVNDNVIQSVQGANFNTYRNQEYTGKAFELSKKDIGAVVVTNIDGTKTTYSTDKYEIVGYENNTNASIFETAVTPSRIAKVPAYVNVKLIDGAYDGKTVKLPFNILPRRVNGADITVPKTVTYDSSIVKASEYALPVAVVAKDSDGKNPITLSSDDFTVKYEYTNTTDKNKVGNTIQAEITITNTNYINGTRNGKTVTVKAADTTMISNPAVVDSMIKVEPGTYTYTGGTIDPSFKVFDGAFELEKDTDYTALVTNAVNVGTGKITVKGIGNYSGTATATFEITPANTSAVKAEATHNFLYNNGKQIRPTKDDLKITLNGNDVSSQFEIASYGENKEAGEGTVVLRLVKNNKNFVGENITVTFKIVREEVTGTIKVYDAYGVDVTADYNAAATPSKTFTYDGAAKEFASVVLAGLTTVEGDATKATVNDFEIKYVDNVVGKYDAAKGCNIAYVYAVAKEGSNYAGAENSKITTADGTVIKNVVAMMPFGIEGVEFNEKNVTVSNATYAGGINVKPEVLVQIGGNTLVEGVDYELKNYGNHSEVTNGKPYTVTVVGKGGYAGSYAAPTTLKWGIDKKNLADCTVKTTNGGITVMNGGIAVPAADYTVSHNDDGTTTIVAVKDSKNYTGSITIAGVNTPEATTLKVTDRTTSTVSLAWDEVEGAEGYTIWFRSEYDTEMSRKIIKGGDVTSWKQTGLQPGTKYFYGMRSWVKDPEGNYVFSEVSPTQRGTTKPEAAVVTGVSADNGYVKVRLAGEAAGAEKYSMCYSKTMNGFDNDDFKVGIRTSYTVRTFKDALDAGTYYVRVKSYRDLGNNKRVYGAWSNAMKVVVK